MNKKLIRLLSLLTCLCLVAGMIPGVTAFAAETETEEQVTSGSCGDNAFWNYNPETKTMIISGTGDMYDGAEWQETSSGKTAVDVRSYQHIVDSVETLIVQEGITEIGYRSFRGCANLVTVVLPKSLNRIGESAFSEAKKLLSIDLPENVVSIAGYAFSDCVKLNKITVRSAVRFGSRVFSDCPNIKNIVFAGNAPSLGFNVSSDESSAVKMNIFSPNVQANAYYPTNRNWTQQDLNKNYGGNLTWIPYTDTEPDIPAEEIEETDGTVTAGYCGDNATWNYNPETKTMTISGTGEMYDGANPVPGFNGVTAYWDKRSYKHIIEDVETLIIQEGITSVGLQSFTRGFNITTVVLPKSLNKIGEMAFYHAEKLLSIDLPENVISIGRQAFYGCRKLNKITVRSDVRFGSEVFSECPNIRNIVFTGNAPSLGFGLSSDESAENISIFSADVRANAYYPTDKNWKQLDFEKNYGGDLTWIPYTDAEPDIPAEELFEQDSGMFNNEALQWHFDEATGVLTISGTGKTGGFHPNMHPWGEWRQLIKEVIIKDGVTDVGCYMFCYDYSLERVILAETITEIDSYAFGGCKALHTIIFTGNAPLIEADSDAMPVFSGVTATAYYPANKNWPTETLQNYGGNLTWIPYTGSIPGIFEPEVEPTEPETEPTEPPHTHEYEAVVTAPTCTEEGYTTYTCACGDSYTDDEVAATGHDWDNGEVTKQPTEEAEGVKTYTCEACGEAKTESIAKLEHVHKYTDKVTAPTCTEKGYTTHTCACGDKKVDTYVEPTGHKWDSGKVTKEPTEKEEGVKTFTCSSCKTTKTEAIAKLAHTHKYTDKVTAPTCTEKGYTTHTCTCGDKKVDTYVEATGHKWDNGKVTKEPTEKEEGVKTFTCSTCKTTKTEAIAKLAHTHKYTDKVTAPTCTEKGYTTHTCACGDKKIDTYVEPTEHKWDSGKVTKEPTEEAEGVKTFTCSVCKKTKTSSIPKLDPKPVVTGTYTTDLVMPAADLGVSAPDAVLRATLTFGEDGKASAEWEAVDLTAFKVFFHDMFVNSYYAMAYGAGITDINEIEQFCIDSTGMSVSAYMDTIVTDEAMKQSFTPASTAGKYTCAQEQSVIYTDLPIMDVPSDPTVPNSFSVENGTLYLNAASYGKADYTFVCTKK